MKRAIFLVLIANYSSLISQSQFQRTIGGTGNDYGYSIVRTTDGGYAVAGGTYSFGGDMYIVKLDASGTLQWSRTIGGTGNDFANSIIQTPDGGYAVAGTRSFGTGGDMYIVKLDASGTLQWSRTIGGSSYDYAYSIIQTTDGGYAVAGGTSSFGAGNLDFYIVKLDDSGTLQWSRTIGGSSDDYALQIIQTTDGGYAVAGGANSFGAGGTDIYIVKLDASGTLQWSRTVGGQTGDDANSITQTTDGGYAAAGATFSFGTGFPSMYIVKLDASGTLQWSRTIVGSSDNYANSIIQTTDGGYGVAGYTGTNPYYDMYIVKLDAAGTLRWSRTIGGTNWEDAWSIIQTIDGGYVAAGNTRSFGAGFFDMYIVKLDGSGNTCGNSTSPTSQTGSGGTTTSPTPTITTPTSTVTTPSSTTSTGGTVTTICVIGIKPISNEIPLSFGLEQNYPNPFNSSSKIKMQISKLGDVKLIIYDILGHEVVTLVNEQLKPGTYEAEWDANNFPSGVYYYRLTAHEVSGSSTGDYQETRKMILLK